MSSIDELRLEPWLDSFDLSGPEARSFLAERARTRPGDVDVACAIWLPSCDDAIRSLIWGGSRPGEHADIRRRMATLNEFLCIASIVAGMDAKPLDDVADALAWIPGRTDWNQLAAICTEGSNFVCRLQRSAGKSMQLVTSPPQAADDEYGAAMHRRASCSVQNLAVDLAAMD